MYGMAAVALRTWQYMGGGVNGVDARMVRTNEKSGAEQRENIAERVKRCEWQWMTRDNGWYSR